jgi:tRNA pseudouridine55 synthase
MGRRRKVGRPLDGVLVLNKAAGMTSNDALQKAKRLFFANKAGHTGALDPLATGVLPVCFGESTKFSQYLLDADKRYRTTFRLGITTDTCDAEGQVIAQQDASAITAEMVEQALVPYRGDILQVPPMYSALKHQGKALYELARQGVEVERQARPVTLYSLELLAFRPGATAEVDLNMFCSKGTYVRSIAQDLGADLGCGAHVTVLHRTQAGPFAEDQAVSLEALALERGERDASVLDHHLLAIDAPVADLPELRLDVDSGYYFSQGQPVMDLRVYRLGDQGDTVRVRREDGVFLGLGEITDDGRVAPRRLVASAS